MTELNSYEHVRFIGYAIPMTPADMVAIGDPNGPGAVAGTYRASADFDTDIRARAAVLKVAVDAASAAIADAPAEGVLNVFVAPEFFWHGTMGPYVFAPGEQDPADAILAVLQETFPTAAYPHFLFVFGSVITSKIADLEAVFADSSTKVRNDIVAALGKGWLESSGPLNGVVFDMLVNFIKNGHAYPKVEVRNRALILSGAAVEGVLSPLGVNALTTEKSFDSNEDFLLWDVTSKPVITEQMTAYPILDITGGDFKRDAHDPHAIFQVPAVAAPINIAVEVCLDHSDRRIRKNIDRNPWPARADGIDLHIIPSCGMQLHAPSVGSRAGGWAFNVDGQYALAPTAKPGVPTRGVVSGVESAYTDYINPAGSDYAAHSQLARVLAPAKLGDEKAPGAADATFAPAPEELATVIAVAGTDDLGAYFAGGAGALHIYGLQAPLPIRP